MKKGFALLAAAMGGVMALCAFGCSPKTETASWYDKEIWQKSETAVSEAVLPTSAAWTDVAVHDPSVFYDTESETYYAFGSHFAVASSKDLITWNQEVSDQQYQKLYGEGNNWKDVLKESVEFTETVLPSTWAPDVMKIGTRYYMYYSLTHDFGSSKSVIGRVSSRNVLGPYTREEIIVQSSGMNGEPNCIDPELFYDKDGNLYMVYGSYYTGIFIKELDEKGLPKVTDPDDSDYFGTMVWKGGYGVSGGEIVEGPFVFWNAETEYYYLMTTYGDLSTDYNMRIARSKTPMGPHTDISGNDLTSYSDGAGVKLAGNYQFSGDRGRAALGHNSVIKKDGKYLVVHHARWADSASPSGVSGPHRVEVRQLFFNEAGWPTLSPNRYAGETLGIVSAEQIAGDYDVIVHSAGTEIKFVPSVKYHFSADGKIQSEEQEAGSWTLKGNYFIEVTLGGVVYRGVVTPGYREYNSKGIFSITAVSDQGLPLWANAT